MNLLSKPQEIYFENGNFKLNHETMIVFDKKYNYHDFESVLLLRDEIKRITGFNLSITTVLQDSGNSIKLQKVKNDNQQFYQLEISNCGIKISSASSTGLFYGIQTLRQIIRENGIELPYINIFDSGLFFGLQKT